MIGSVILYIIKAYKVIARFAYGVFVAHRKASIEVAFFMTLFGILFSVWWYFESKADPTPRLILIGVQNILRGVQNIEDILRKDTNAQSEGGYAAGNMASGAENNNGSVSHAVRGDVGAYKQVIKNIFKSELIEVSGSWGDGLSIFKDCEKCPEMVTIPAGEFVMGSNKLETQRMDKKYGAHERPQHIVSISIFAVGRDAITFDQWSACVADGGCNDYSPKDEGWGRGSHPVINVSWDDAQAYVAWLNRKVRERDIQKLDSFSGPYRLLSEAEWEYAARAGTSTARWWGDQIGRGNANCLNCGSPFDHMTAPIGSFDRNNFGLGVLGNVWEWVFDCWAKNYDGARKKGGAWTYGDCRRRVVRGGSWISDALFVRSASRDSDVHYTRDPYTGFRVARDLH